MGGYGTIPAPSAILTVNGRTSPARFTSILMNWENEMKDEDILTATEVNERWCTLNAALRERESTTDKWMDDLAARVAGALIESVGDDLSADQLEQLLAIRDGNESCAT